ncbi:CUB and sushi domain-containing protein 1-like isoform X2 [Corticium candelabrum]|uniref:CUB and sushi domain-containing protein 1-like isoform X2 n=1 Tax=Corticium candelabrum TaxID=121492 RepID=UPI002E252DC1|nr:CUB and sushi domain-containing protein 1-like isoform X2 [Corticium candelabrum]
MLLTLEELCLAAITKFNTKTRQSKRKNMEVLLDARHWHKQQLAFYSTREMYTLAILFALICLVDFSSAAECSNPGRQQFGYRIGNSFTENAEVRYVCRSGYTLVGSSTSRCNCTRGACNWNPPQPKCIRACRNPGKIGNGHVLGTEFQAGRSLRYRCAEGYRVSGSDYSVCRCFGSSCRWVPPPASCVPLECPAPDNITNGLVLGTKFLDHHWIAFQCLPGYQLNGSSHSICSCSNDTCSWSSPPPKCIELACGDPGVPEHGNRVGPTNFTAGALVSYSCDSDYYLLGQSESTCYCLPNTCQWLPSRPVCTKGCGKPHPIPHCITSGTDCGPGGTVQFQCLNGYWLEGSRSASCVCTGGQCHWDPIPPHCIELQCPRPRKPKNGYRRGRNFGLGDRVSFGCRFGYDLQGSHESVCRCVGKNCNWQPRLDQTCVAVQAMCAASELLPYGRVIGSQREVGRTVQYVCNSGYRLEGAETSVCSCHGHPQTCSWVPQPPRCVLVACEAPKLDHGRVMGTSRMMYAARQLVRFSCHSGFALSDSSDRVCKCSKGTCHWSPSLPTCIKNQSAPVCPRPLPVVNGHVTLSGQHVGSVAIYECYYGFHLRGQRKGYCRSNGTWSSAPPVCSRVR